jgi:hypothetical protein
VIINDGLALHIFRLVRGLPKCDRVDHVKMMINGDTAEVQELLDRGEQIHNRLPQIRQRQEKRS